MCQMIWYMNYKENVFRPFSENSLVNQRVLFYNRRTTKEKKEGNP